MSRASRWWWIGVAAALSACSGKDRPAMLETSGTSGALPDSADGRLLGSTCPVTIPVGYAARCGTLTVPENRAGTGTATDELGVMVLRGKTAGALPVVYLEGGPGGRAIDNVIALIDYFAPILDAHDLVVFDQRGAGFDQPSLECPEIDRVEGSSASLGELHAAEVDAVAACRARLVASGVDPAAYTTRANAADVDDLRAELGYSKWHLFGVSYGTRLALDVERLFPAGVASVVIDSVLPPNVDFLAQAVPDALRSFRQTFAGCAAQSDCARAYPNLEATLSSVVSSLDQAPVTLTLKNGSSVSATGDDILNLLFLLSYSTDGLALLPEIITEFSEADYSVLRAFYESTGGGGAGGVSVSWGMYLSIMCSEYAAFSSPATVDAANAGLDPLFVQALGSKDLFDVCAAWNVPAAPAVERAPVQSAIPTLVLAGQYDPVTPPAWSEGVASTLSSSYFVLFQNETHGAFTNPCGGTLLRTFWSAPTKDPSAVCPGRNDALQFNVLPSRLPAGASLSRPNLAALVPESVVESLRRWVR